MDGSVVVVVVVVARLLLLLLLLLEEYDVLFKLESMLVVEEELRSLGRGAAWSP